MIPWLCTRTVQYVRAANDHVDMHFFHRLNKIFFYLYNFIFILFFFSVRVSKSINYVDTHFSRISLRNEKCRPNRFSLFTRGPRRVTFIQTLGQHCLRITVIADFSGYTVEHNIFVVILKC